MHSFIYLLVFQCDLLSTYSCPGPIWVTQNNYELLSLIPFPYGSERTENIRKTKQYILLWIFFFFPSPHCPLPLLFLSIPAPPFSSIPGFKEIRKLELGVKDGFKKTVILCISVNLSRVSDKMWAAELWKEQTSVTSSVPSFCSCLFWAVSHQLCARHEDSGGTNQRWLPSSWSTYSGVWWVEQTKKSAHTKCHKLS